jgi:hypothetical protein
MQKLIVNDSLRAAIIKKRGILFDLLRFLRQRGKNAPSGMLKTVKKGNSLQFYIRSTPEDRQGTYINRKNLQVAAKLAQKKYNLQLEKVLQKQLDALDYALCNYSETELLEFFQKYPSDLQKMISPLCISPAQYAEQWQSVTFKPLPFENDAPDFITARGERVRSKSEILIANALFYSGVPYLYEYPVAIKGRGDFHPDFMCLNLKDGTSVIWEHFGLMDNPDYCDKALSKIALYSSSGWIPWKNFIYTLESKARPLSPRLVDKIIKENFA